MFYDDLPPAIPYTFLQLDGGAGGNKVIATADTTGIFFGRAGLVQQTNSEAYQSTSSLYIRADEPFIATVGGFLKLVGHGVTVEGEDYRISGVAVGNDLETGAVAFYKATLKKESLWASSLPLE